MAAAHVRQAGLWAAVCAALLLAAAGARADGLKETPFFAKAVAAGKLPKVEDRVPQEPAVAHPDLAGKPGGELRMLMA
ncbi:MAG: hypothetical protein ACREFH_16145, partial [Stellaceae bacterium]